MSEKQIQSALISVYHKDGLDPILEKLQGLDVKIYSTGGTYDYIQSRGYDVTAVEKVTEYPSIFGGRVKTLHPKIFGGILYRRDNSDDIREKNDYDVPSIDLVIVDLYPFEETVAEPNSTEEQIIEKIDIGGIALIRGAAKNFNDVLIVPSRKYYSALLDILNNNGGRTSLSERKSFAAAAFDVSSHYDSAIHNHISTGGDNDTFKYSSNQKKVLRYGENPHQSGAFFGNLEGFFDQLHGKEISYNNLIDIEAAVQLISEFNDGITFGILKHNNACGLATADSVKKAYLKALEADTISAFGGILITNNEIDESAAIELNKLFFEIVIAPGYSSQALDILKQKKNRIILVQKSEYDRKTQFRSLLNGVVTQDYDSKTDSREDLEVVTKKSPTEKEIEELLFASKICKHSKSNTIVLTNNGQLLASGVGQTSRVDALEQAIAKAKKFGFDLSGSVMASDAFFPFPDCVEIAEKQGIKAVIQPGGSVKDDLSINFCDDHNMAMVFTGHRHFKH